MAVFTVALLTLGAVLFFHSTFTGCFVGLDFPPRGGLSESGLSWDYKDVLNSIRDRLRA